jgi:hypothetical protein
MDEKEIKEQVQEEPKAEEKVIPPKEDDFPKIVTQAPDPETNPGNVKGILFFFLLIAFVFIGIYFIPPLVLRAREPEETTKTTTFETNFAPIDQGETTRRTTTSRTTNSGPIFSIPTDEDETTTTVAATGDGDFIPDSTTTSTTTTSSEIVTTPGTTEPTTPTTTTSSITE